MCINLRFWSNWKPLPLLLLAFVISFSFFSYSFTNFHSVETNREEVRQWVEEMDGSSNSINCTTSSPEPHTSIHGEYLIYYNYIMRTSMFRCDESIVLTTHGESQYILENVETLARKWNGPVGISVVTMGSDYEVALRTIMYLRKCGDPIVRSLVTFHFVFKEEHLPDEILLPDEVSYFEPELCSQDSFPVLENATYRKEHELIYPINVARNAARDAANTYFVLPSDIELYPSIDFIPQFMDFIRGNFHLLTRQPPRVFVLPVFEVAGNETVPETKGELVDMFLDKKVVVFHSNTCPGCQRMPKLRTWLRDNDPERMGVNIKTKRTGVFKHWEPIYVGTHLEAPFDERLSWEGRKDKMVQMAILCVMNYDLMILNNAFLVHKPGIKKKIKGPDPYKPYIEHQNRIIDTEIKPEINRKYGYKKRCAV